MDKLISFEWKSFHLENGRISTGLDGFGSTFIDLDGFARISINLDGRALILEGFERISIDLQGLGGFYINISFGLDGLGRVSIDL